MLEVDKRDHAKPYVMRLRQAIAAGVLAAALALLFAIPAHAQLPPPVVGETVNLEPVDGTVSTKCEGVDAFTELTEPAQVDVGCVVDATDGTVKVTSATGVGDETQTARLWDGRFRILQDAEGAPPVTTSFELVGPLDEDSESGEKRRDLWGRGDGNFESRGQKGAAVIRGTTWLVEDFSNDSTKVTVREGTVSFFDAVLGITVTVRAGESYTSGQGVAAPPLGQSVTVPPGNAEADQYFETTPSPFAAVTEGEAQARQAAGDGALPLTGLPIGWLIGGGLLLLAVGLGVARLARSAPHP